MVALYQLTSSYRKLENMSDGDISEAEFLEAIDIIDDEIKAKGVSIGFLLGNLEASAKSMKEAEQKISQRRKTIEARIETIKNYLLSNMQMMEITKLECNGYFTISRQKNPPSVVVTDESLIPIKYLRQPEPPPPKPDKVAMLSDMKEGVIIDGAYLEQKERIVIK